MLIKNVRCKRVYQVILSYNIPGIANLVNSEKCQKNGWKDRRSEGMTIDWKFYK